MYKIPGYQYRAENKSCSTMGAPPTVLLLVILAWTAHLNLGGNIVWPSNGHPMMGSASDNTTMAHTRKAIDETKISVDGVSCTEIVCLFREPNHSRPEGWTADQFLNAFCKCKGEMEMERRKPEELKCQGNSSWHNFVVEMIVQNIGKLCYRLQNSWKYWRTEELFLPLQIFNIL